MYLAEYLAKKPGFMLVSHDRHLLDGCADHILSIDGRGVKLHSTGFGHWREQMALEEEHERRRDAKLRRRIRSLEQAARQRRTWSQRKEKEKIGAYDKGFVSHQAARQMKRAVSIERRRCGNRYRRAYQTPLWQEGDLRTLLQREGVEEPRFRTTLGSMGVTGEVFERPLETFSQGERKKVDLCRSFLEPSHLLIWDEPLNYIDLLSREQIAEVVLSSKPTILFVEQDRWFIERVATSVLDMG